MPDVLRGSSAVVWLLLSLALAMAPTALAQEEPAVAPHPGYDAAEAWLCRPGREDACAADLTATVIAADGTLTVEPFEPAGDPTIDCFYVYPTVSRDATPNSDMVAGPEELSVIQQQFARFGAVCRTFAPLYRQVTLTALRSAMAGSPMAADRDLGYRDVVDAWNHYLEHDNDGRGVVLIGHSQGAGVLTRLIREEIDGKQVQGRIVSALIVGSTVQVPADRDVGGSFETVPLCRSGEQTGCVIAYATFRSTVPPPATSFFGRGQGETVAACTNPASLAGGSGELHPYLASSGNANGSALAPGPWVIPEVEITTPFVRLPSLLTAECVSKPPFSYLEVTLHADPENPRTDDIVGDVVVDGVVQENWGLHLIDMNVAMGDLIAIVGRQAEAWSANR